MRVSWCVVAVGVGVAIAGCHHAPAERAPSRPLPMRMDSHTTPRSSVDPLDAPGRGSIRGRVGRLAMDYTGFVDQHAFVSVRVRAWPKRTTTWIQRGVAEATSDERGYYTLRDLVPGPYMVIFDHADWLAIRHIVVEAGQTTAVFEDANPDRIATTTPSLTSGRGAIAGHVSIKQRSRDMFPPRIEPSATLGHGGAWRQRGSTATDMVEVMTTTDPHGGYMLLDLEPGHYVIEYRYGDHVVRRYADVEAATATLDEQLDVIDPNR